MALPKNPIRKARPKPVSFRLSDEAFARIRALATYLGYSQAELIERLVGTEYRHHSKRDPKALALAERQARRKGKG